MASLYTQQARNVRRTYMLMTLFSLIVIVIGWGVSWYFESFFVLLFVVFVTILMNVSAYWYSDRIAIRLTHAHPITRESHPTYWNLAENLCISIGAPMPKLYIIDDVSPNAFATGRSPKRSAIAVTQGLLDLMEKTELEGVIAHELAHIQNRDTLLMTVIVVLFGVVTLLLDIVLRSTLYGDSKKNGAMFLIAIAAYLLAPILLTIIKYAVSRKREFLADATAAVYTRYPDGLASALRKIEGVAKPMQHANSATAHLFIADPFAETEKRKHKGIAFSFHRMFETHPSVDARVEALMGGAVGEVEKA